jgi:hypothetical protein
MIFKVSDIVKLSSRVRSLHSIINRSPSGLGTVSTALILTDINENNNYFTKKIKDSEKGLFGKKGFVTKVLLLDLYKSRKIPFFCILGRHFSCPEGGTTLDIRNTEYSYSITRGLQRYVVYFG